MLARLIFAALCAAALDPRLAAAACAGDCNGDGSVAINELVLGVGIALGTAELRGCAGFDGDGDGQVAIHELVAGVNAALGGCGGATPGPTATATPRSGGSGTLAFAVNDNQTFSADIAIINVDGTGRRKLTDTADDSESQPVWSPDGTRIAFIDNGGISVMNADGSDRHQVAAGNRAPSTRRGTRMAARSCSVGAISIASRSSASTATTGAPCSAPTPSSTRRRCSAPTARASRSSAIAPTAASARCSRSSS